MLTCALDQRRWLRLLEESDAEELYAVVDANRGYLARWMPWAQDDDLEKVQDFIRVSRRQFADNDGFSPAIVEDGRIVGSIGFHRVDRATRVERVGDHWVDHVVYSMLAEEWARRSEPSPAP